MDQLSPSQYKFGPPICMKDWVTGVGFPKKDDLPATPTHNFASCKYKATVDKEYERTPTALSGDVTCSQKTDNLFPAFDDSEKKIRQKVSGSTVSTSSTTTNEENIRCVAAEARSAIHKLSDKYLTLIPTLLSLLSETKSRAVAELDDPRLTTDQIDQIVERTANQINAKLDGIKKAIGDEENQTDLGHLKQIPKDTMQARALEVLAAAGARGPIVFNGDVTIHNVDELRSMARVRIVPDRRPPRPPKQKPDGPPSQAPPTRRPEGPPKETPPTRRDSDVTANEPGTSGTQLDSDASRKHSKQSHDELKLLQDSLTSFFTPTTGRRCRQPPRKFDEESDDEKRMQRPLTVDVSSPPADAKPVPLASGSSNRSSEISPSRRACERLMDSLSPYFCASSEKRRSQQRTEKTEKRNDPTPGPSPGATVKEDPDVLPPPQDPPRKMSHRSRRTEEALKPVVGGRGTQNSASAALFSSPLKEESRSSSESLSPPQKRVRTPKVLNPLTTARKKLRAVDESDTEKTSEPGSDYKVTPNVRQKKMKERTKKKSISTSVVSPGSGSGEKENLGAEGLADGSINVTSEAEWMFAEAQKRAQNVIDEAIKNVAGRVTAEDPTKEPRWPLAIRISNFEVTTWYSAPYPQEYAHVPVLHICEFCLKYTKSANILSHHRRKCEWRHPPGNEIYRNNNISVFEVDGNVSRIYCQNLCLIAKLFLDHKTLYYDVEPFLFYVVTFNDNQGCHFVGYFSKEKYSAQKFNLSCIVTLPCYQKKGFGRFLIDFSFLLSRREDMLGTPERPLSDLGRISYGSYWRTTIFEWIHEHVTRSKKFTLMDIARGTGVSVFDITEVLDALQWMQKGPDGLFLELNWSMINDHWKKAKAEKNRIWLNEASLKWVPVNHTPSKDFGLRSPVMTLTPHRSPMNSSTVNVGSTPTGVSIAAVGSTVKKGVGPNSGLRSTKRSGARQLKLSSSRRNDSKLLTSEESSSSDVEDERPSRKGCTNADQKRRLGRRDDTDDDEDGSTTDTRRAPQKGKKGSGEAAASSTTTRKETTTSSNSGRRCTVSRGKAVYEGDESSSFSSSSDDDLDESFSVGKGRSKPQKGSKGKGPPVQRRRKPPPKKAGKSPGKVFPANYGGRASSPTRRRRSPVRCDSPATSVASAATVPMRLGHEEGRVSTPGGGRTMLDVEDDVPAPSSPSTSSQPLVAAPPPTSQRNSRASVRGGIPISSNAASSAAESSDESRAPSVCTRSASNCSSRAETPRPLGDRVPQPIMMNMGGVPDPEDEIADRHSMSEDNDAPPQLHAEPMAISSYEAPPQLSISAADGGASAPALSSYSTDDDDAPPPCLSPALSLAPEKSPAPPQNMPDECLTEEERRQRALEKPPRGPAMPQTLDEDELALAYHTHMEPSGSGSAPMLTNQSLTPQHPYPGSLTQMTPGSVPSCHMLNQTTPEQQAQFMSPQMQGVMQPSSVSSVHSVHNASMEMAPGSSGQAFPPLSVVAPPQNNDPSPLRNNCHPHGAPVAAFASPPGQVQPLRASTDAVPTTTASRKESSKKSRSMSQQQPQHHQQQQLQAQQANYMNMNMMGYQHPYSMTGYPPGYGFPGVDPFQASFQQWTTPNYQPYAKGANQMTNMYPVIYNNQHPMARSTTGAHQQQPVWPTYPATAGPIPQFPAGAAAAPAFCPPNYFGHTPYFYNNK